MGVGEGGDSTGTQAPAGGSCVEAQAGRPVGKG